MSQRERQREDRRTVRGYKISDFAQREGVAERTIWRWAEKGIVQVSRLAPATGIRVHYRAGDPDIE